MADLYTGKPNLAERVSDRADVYDRLQVNLFSPFVPFICIFGNVIAQSDLQDFALLGNFVISCILPVTASNKWQSLSSPCLYRRGEETRQA